MHPINQAMDYLKNGWQLEVNTSSNFGSTVRRSLLGKILCSTLWHLGASTLEICLLTLSMGHWRLRATNWKPNESSKNDCSKLFATISLDISFIHPHVFFVYSLFLFFLFAFSGGENFDMYIVPLNVNKTRRPILDLIYCHHLRFNYSCHKLLSFFSLLRQATKTGSLKIRFG